MRATIILAALVACAAHGSCLALQASDTMAVWSAAPADEKTKLMTEILRRDGYSGSTASVVSCLDAASKVEGHADLLIAEVAKACRTSSGNPV